MPKNNNNRFGQRFTGTVFGKKSIRDALVELLNCFYSPKITVRTLGADGKSSIDTDATLVMGPLGWSATIDLTGKIAGGTSGSGGGVNYKTTNYAALSSDAGKLISFNSGSALTLTLPSPPPSATWFIAVECVGAGGLTVNRNGLFIDVSAANVALTQNQGVFIYTDGTNYFTSRGVGGTAAASSIQQYKITAVYGDFVLAQPFNGTSYGSAVVVAKPAKLRKSITTETINNINYTYSYTMPGYSGSDNFLIKRTAAFSSTSEKQIVVPWFLDSDIIYVQTLGYNLTLSDGLASPTNYTTNLIDINADGRAWCRAYNQTTGV